MLLPQELTAVTETLPLPDPGTTEIEVVVELPVHPEGKVQV